MARGRDWIRPENSSDEQTCHSCSKPWQVGKVLPDRHCSLIFGRLLINQAHISLHHDNEMGSKLSHWKSRTSLVWLLSNCPNHCKLVLDLVILVTSQKSNMRLRYLTQQLLLDSWTCTWMIVYSTLYFYPMAAFLGMK